MLTKRQLEILTLLMALPENEREILCDGERCAVGQEFISRATVNRLLGHMAITDSGYSSGDKIQIFIPTQNTGQILARPALADEMVARVIARKPFFVNGDGAIQDA